MRSDDKLKVGAEAGPANTPPPAVYGQVWVYNTTIDAVISAPSDPNYGNLGGEFGSADYLSGRLLAVGAPYESLGSLTQNGEAFVYDWNYGTMIGSALTSPNSQSDGHFGSSIAISGGLLAVGAPGELGNLGNGSGPGEVYTYSIPQVSLNVTAGNGGSLTVQSSSIDNGVKQTIPSGSSTSYNVNAGTYVTVGAIASPGWNFFTWNGQGGSDNNSTAFDVDSNMSLSAIFASLASTTTSSGTASSAKISSSVQSSSENSSSTSALSSSMTLNEVNASVSTSMISSSSSVTPSQVSTQTIEIAAIAIVTLVFGSTAFFAMRRRHAN